MAFNLQNPFASSSNNYGGVASFLQGKSTAPVFDPNKFSFKAKVNPNGEIGWDFFYDGKPTTIENYMSFARGNQDEKTNDLNNSAKALAQSSQGPSAQDAYNQGIKDASAKKSTARAGTSRAAAQAPAAPPPPPVWQGRNFNGQWYTDPKSFADAEQSYLDQVYGNNLQGLNRGFSNQIGRDNLSGVDINNVGGEFGRNKSTILKQVADLLEQYGTQQTDANANIGAYYSNLGDIYQSSQGVRQTKSDTEFDKARTDVNTQKTDKLGALDRALQDYLYQGNQQRNQLAQQYQGAKDQIINTTANDYQNLNPVNVNGAISYANPVAASVNTQVNGGVTSNLSDLANNLLQLKSGNVFKQFGTAPGKIDTNAILQYLYGQGA